jgi:hypothetical protein
MFNWKFIGIFIVCAGVFLYYFGYFEKPEDRVEDFIEAFNNNDLREMMDMIDNPDVNQLKSGLGFIGTLSDAILGVDMYELLLDFLPISEGLLGSDGMNMNVYDVHSVDMDILRTEATVVVEVEVESDGGYEMELWEVDLEKKDREWIIKDIIESN